MRVATAYQTWLLSALLLSDAHPSADRFTHIDRELAEVRDSGYTVRILTPEEGRLPPGTHRVEGDLWAGSLVEITEEWSNFRHVKTLAEPSSGIALAVIDVDANGLKEAECFNIIADSAQV